jgi:hypothetical protein
MATLSDLVELLPEFTDAVNSRPAMVQGHLDAAAPEVSAEVWGASYTLAVCLKAAHSLALSPFGTQARLEGTVSETVYSARFENMRKRLPTRFLLA